MVPNGPSYTFPLPIGLVTLESPYGIADDSDSSPVDVRVLTYNL